MGERRRAYGTLHHRQHLHHVLVLKLFQILFQRSLEGMVGHVYVAVVQLADAGITRKEILALFDFLYVFSGDGVARLIVFGEGV